eukprot:6202172-Pleurochrysis_carterae.AAC.1
MTGNNIQRSVPGTWNAEDGTNMLSVETGTQNYRAASSASRAGQRIGANMSNSSYSRLSQSRSR